MLLADILVDGDTLSNIEATALIELTEPDDVYLWCVTFGTTTIEDVSLVAIQTTH